MKSLSCLSEAPGLSSEQRKMALKALIDYCFHQKPIDFHILNLTVTDLELSRHLQRQFPISKMTAGWLFEVTSPERKPTLLKEELIFEGSFF